MIAERLTMATAEVEAVETLTRSLDGVRVGKVVSVEAVSDTNAFVRVECGPDTFSTVCGRPMCGRDDLGLCPGRGAAGRRDAPGSTARSPAGQPGRAVFVRGTRHGRGHVELWTCPARWPAAVCCPN